MGTNKPLHRWGSVQGFCPNVDLYTSMPTESQSTGEVVVWGSWYQSTHRSPLCHHSVESLTLLLYDHLILSVQFLMIHLYMHYSQQHNIMWYTHIMWWMHHRANLSSWTINGQILHRVRSSTSCDFSFLLQVAWLKLKNALKTVLFNQMFVNLPFSVVLYFIMQWRGGSVHADLPTFKWVLLEIAVFLIFEEIGFYYFHR